MLFGLLELACFLTAAVCTHHAAESKDGSVRRKWLTFWLLYCPFYALEALFPLYGLKTAFVVAMAHPQFHGAETFYRVVVEPFLIRHEDAVDTALAKSRVHASAAADKIRAGATSQIQQHGMGLLVRAQAYVTQLVASSIAKQQQQRQP